ncbi:hypothetical protein ABEB36_005911 [Hypothenemus hampei]|uniref:Uncharacterized protein n=1 Tax=Hypothenemus hampei TaxID=57062 RepID=A0ABD1F0A4_HYPHA
MKTISCGFFLVFSLLVGQSIAKLSVTHSVATRKENGTFNVYCKDLDAGSKVTWKGPNNRPLGEKTSPLSKITMHGTQLTFTMIKKEDAGTYVCSSGSESITFELVVSGDIEFVDTPASTVAEENSKKVLKCEVKQARTEWIVDTEPPDEDKYTVLADGLLIKNVSISDADRKYICRGFNVATGDFADKKISLVVIHPPRPPRLTYAKDNIVHGYIGGIVNLTCEVEARPPPKIEWYQRESGEKIIGKRVTTDNPNVSTLLVMIKKPEDFTDYKCQATNSRGKLDTIFTVVEGTQPYPPISLEVKNANSSALFVHVEEPELTEAENRTKMEPTGVRIEYRSHDDPEWNVQSFSLTEDKIYVISDLAKNTTYQVRAATENIAGFSEFTNITEYTTSSFASVLSSSPFIALFGAAFQAIARGFI